MTTGDIEPYLKQGFARAFYSRTHCWRNLILFILKLGWFILRIAIPRRLRQGPRRASWTWIHELAVESMQFSYQWFLKMATIEPLPYHRVWDQQLPARTEEAVRFLVKCSRANLPLKPWAKLLPSEKASAIRLFHQDMNTISVEDLRSFCAVTAFQEMILWLRFCQVPYGLLGLCSKRLDLMSDHQTLPVDIIKKSGSTDKRNRIGILYVHGGAFCFRVEFSWRFMVRYFVTSLDAVVVIPHYRLAPQYPFPSGIHDILETYQWMLKPVSEGGGGFSYDRIVFVGESAGGGALVSSLLRSHIVSLYSHLPVPRGVVLMSPWIDLTCTSVPPHPHFNCESKNLVSSWVRNHPLDILHLPTWPFDLSRQYAGVPVTFKGKSALSDFQISPWFADDDVLSKALPEFIMVQVGGNEFLADEGIWLAQRMVNTRSLNTRGEWLFHHTSNNPNVKLIDKNRPIQCHIFEDMTHVFQLFYPVGIPQAGSALSISVQFIKNCFHDE